MFRSLPALVTVFLMLFGLASTVLAQAAPVIDQAPENNAWKTPAAAILLGGFIIAASIKKSKREHRD